MKSFFFLPILGVLSLSLVGCEDSQLASNERAVDLTDTAVDTGVPMEWGDTIQDPEDTAVADSAPADTAAEVETADTGLSAVDTGDVVADTEDTEDTVVEDTATAEIEPADTAYEGGWSIGTCEEDIVATGNGVGDVAEDFALTDQYGEIVRLHSFCDRAVLIVACVGWSEECKDRAADLQGFYEAYEPRGLVVIELLAEDGGGDTPSTEDLSAWAATYGITFPVLSDPGLDVTFRFEQDGSLPSFTLLAPDALVAAVDTALTTDDINSVLP